MALNNILGIDVNKAYIWGKKYIHEKKGVTYENNNFLKKLGLIDYDNIDFEYVNQTNDALDWLRALRKDGSNWSLLPIPSRSELFPNMKNEKDGQWHGIKTKLNNEINEITSVWNCGIKKRKIAHSKNVFSWKDKRCTSKLMGFNKGKISHTIDKILKINRQGKYVINKGKIMYDRENWFKANEKTMEFYLDFETFNSNFGSIIKDGEIAYNDNQYIFLIGVGYKKNNKWEFKNFLLDNKTQDSEIKMAHSFIEFINSLLKKNNKTIAKFYHWSHAETTFYNKFKNKNQNLFFKDEHFQFYDLNKVFVSEPIPIKGALNFSLKTIAKALNKYGLIKSCWDNSSPCSNGLSAMILANNIYSKNDLESEFISQEPVMKEIIKYNEIDCKVMWEIHELIKKNN